jgi:hypothetical protein
MNFNLNATTGAKEAGSVLRSGIHDAKFVGITKDSINGRDGSVYDVMSVTFDVNGFGEYKWNVFEPTSSERTTSQFGENPSQIEHFLIIVRQIVDALDPKIGEGIDNGTITISGTFSQVVNTVKKLTSPYSGNTVQIKLLPGKNGFASLPNYPARITKTGSLGISTRFIAKENLTLTDYEKKKIDAVNNAAPTNMATTSATNDLLDGMKSQMDDDDLDDLPFN